MPGPGIPVLEAADVARYLLDRELLSPRAVVDGGLRVVDRSRLNRVFVATADRERCLVLKAGGPAPAREAAVLERLRIADRGGELARALPVTVAHDGAAEVLVLESAPDAHDLADHCGRGRFSRALAREAGRALARLHTISPRALDGLGPVDRAAADRLGALRSGRPGARHRRLLRRAPARMAAVDPDRRSPRSRSSASTRPPAAAAGS